MSCRRVSWLFALLLVADLAPATLAYAAPDDGSVRGRILAQASERSAVERLATFDPAVQNANGEVVDPEPTVVASGLTARPSKPCATNGCISIERPSADELRASEGSRERLAPSLTSGGIFPSACYAYAGATTNRDGRVYSRNAACIHDRVRIMVFNEKGEVTGRSWLDIAVRLATALTSANMYAEVETENWDVTGNGEVATVTTAFSGYTKTGTALEELFWSQKSPIYWSGNATISRPGIKVGQVVNPAGGIFRFTISGVLGTIPPSCVVQVPTVRVRCDQVVRYYRGCVFPQHAGRMSYSSASYPTFTRHVKAALKSGLPGNIGTKSYLGRITSKTLSAKNGRTACPSTLKKPSGKSCDEYPFRSTKQGAYTGGHPKFPRTFKWCQISGKAYRGSKGFSRCFIKAGENNGAGALLGSFYKFQHILNGDKFQVGFLG